ncbi:hypothetical protein ACLOJK_039657 [Asimina triloba]
MESEKGFVFHYQRCQQQLLLFSSGQSMGFFRFVSCYGPPTLPDGHDSTQRIQDSATLSPRTCAPEARLAARKSGAGRSNVALWRPSLMAISEDSVVCVGPTNQGERTVRSSGKNSAAKRNSRPKIVVRDYNEQWFGPSTYGSVAERSRTWNGSNLAVLGYSVVTVTQAFYSAGSSPRVHSNCLLVLNGCDSFI